VLREFRALGGVLVALATDPTEEVEVARAFFDDMPFPVRILWTNIRQCGLDALAPRKAWAVWQDLGVASLDAELIALSDADIRTFSSSYPLRMLSLSS